MSKIDNAIQKFKLFGICTVLALALTACAPTKIARGNYVEPYELSKIVPGETLEEEVAKTLGTPTTRAPFNDDIWYYIGEKRQKQGFLDPKVLDRRVIEIEFDPETRKVVRVQEMTDDGMVDLPLVQRTTPTAGNEISPIQQLLGNLGRFNTPQGERGRDGIGAPGR